MNSITRFLSIAALITAIGTTNGIAQTKTTETETTESSSSTNGGATTTTTTTTRVSKSEDITPRENMITVDPVKFFSLYNISFLHKVSPNVAVGAGIQSPTGLIDATGFGVSGEVAFYPTGKLFRGFHIGGNIAYNNVTTTSTIYNYDPNTGNSTTTTLEETVAPISIGTSIGWHWYPWDEFATEIGLGADIVMNGRPKNDADRNSFIGQDEVPFLTVRNGVWPSVRFRIGYAW